MHLLVAITSHGFGHAAQVAPVINAFTRRMPASRVTVFSSLPEPFLRDRIRTGFDLLPLAPDFGLIMNSALEIDLAASAAAYAGMHANWQTRVEREARRLEGIAPDLVLADIPYLTLAAARLAGIPSVALCSLNWADIYRWYFSSRQESAQVLEQMEEAYRSARVFLCPEPSMPMPFLDNRLSIGPIALKGECHRDALRSRLKVDPDDALVLVAPGGVSARFAIEEWPAHQGIRWLVPDNWQVQRADVVPIARCGLGFTDLIASCDAVLGKCGYGTVTECVVNSTPLLHIERPDWPEERCLLDWLNAHRAGVAIDAGRLRTGDFAEPVRRACALSVASCAADGDVQAAAVLERVFIGAEAGTDPAARRFALNAADPDNADS